MNSIERRNLDSGVELRADGDAMKIGGHAAVFNEQVEIFPGFEERFESGAFTETIKSDDIRALWNHDPAFVMGRNKSGTLRLSEDDRGLVFENDPPDAQWAKDIVVSIKRGDISGASIGFRVVKETWEHREDGVEVRSIQEAKLFDVSPVAFPAYPQTDVAVRSLLECSPGMPVELRDVLVGLLSAVHDAEQGSLETIITEALESQTEAIAVRVAAIIQEQRAKARVAGTYRGRRLDLEQAS